MPDPGFTKPDRCSMCAVASRAACATAVRGLLSDDGYPLAGDDPLVPVARDVARTLGTGGAWLITGHPSWRTGAGR